MEIETDNTGRIQDMKKITNMRETPENEEINPGNKQYSRNGINNV